MKKSLVSFATIVALAGLICPASSAFAQAETPHKVGLIDMAHVFQNYKKFETLREQLKAEIAKTDSDAKQIAERMKSVQAEMKDLKSGSPAYVESEKKLLSLKGEFDAFTQGARRDLMRRESEIYKEIYMEVTDAVKKYAEYYKYTLVIRFNRQPLDEKATPPEVVQRMNKQVVFFRADDDITDSVLQFLNRTYTMKSGGTQPDRAAAGAAGTRRN